MAQWFMEHKRAQAGEATANHGVVDFDGDTLKVALIDTATVDPDYTTHEDWADVSTAVIGTATTMASPVWDFATPPNVDLDFTDTVISSVAGPTTAEELVVFKDTGVAATSPLIGQWDSGDVTNLPVTPNGGDITVVWHADGVLRW